MAKPESLALGALGIALAFGVPTVAAAQSAFTMANNDSIYVVGDTFKVQPGKAKGDISNLIAGLGARELGPGAIIFRSDGKLYIANAPPQGGARLSPEAARTDRYGSDRDTSVSAAQSDRDWQEYLRSRYGAARYGSDRDTSVSAAQSDRDWQDYLRSQRSARFGSDRDTSVSAAQSDRDWQEYLRSRPGGARDGSDRDTSVSGAQSERDWQEYLRSRLRRCPLWQRP